MSALGRQPVQSSLHFADRQTCAAGEEGRAATDGGGELHPFLVPTPATPHDTGPDREILLRDLDPLPVHLLTHATENTLLRNHNKCLLLSPAKD